MPRRPALLAGVLAAVAAAAFAGDLRPPLVGMSPHADPGKVVSIDLPVNWKDETLGPNFGAVAHWSGFFQPPKPDGPDAHVYVDCKPTWSRVGLAHESLSRSLPGAFVDGSLRRGDGWIEEVRAEPAKQRHLLVRFVESHGQVFQVLSWSDDSIFPHIDDHLRALHDTFKVQAAWPAFKPPDGYASSTVDGTTVWTDTKDKKTLKRILDAHAAAFATMANLLTGDRAIADPPVVVVCDKDATYAQVAAVTEMPAGPLCFPDYQRRLFVARVSGRSNAMLDASVQGFAATQFVQLYFGGKTNDWLDRGLSMWATAAIAAKGKPEKPTAEYVKAGKDGVAASKESLEQMFAVERNNLAKPDFELFDGACYAWQCFFRFGAGAKPYGDRFAQYIADLRRTGSCAEAKKAWDGVDQAALNAEFRTWVAAWK